MLLTGVLIWTSYTSLLASVYTSVKWGGGKIEYLHMAMVRIKWGNA